MATRATYEIEGQCFYCHWDGYPAGAAARMVKMIEALTQPHSNADLASFEVMDDRRGGLPFAFIRGNMDAEPTTSRHSHGDTEWHYQVYTSKQTGLIRCLTFAKAWDAATFTLKADERLEEFCDRHGREWKLPKIIPVHRKTREGKVVVTLATEDAARKIAALHRANAARFDDDNPNKATNIKAAEEWEVMLELLGLPVDEAAA